MNQRLTDLRRAQLDQLLSGGTNMAGGGLLKAVAKAAKPAAKAVTKVVGAAPQAEALRLAQQRAALPPAKGGLGLAASNTAEQRAAAMGINTDAYHGTKQDIKGAFVPGYNDDLAFVTKDPDFASKWVGKGKMQKRIGAEDEQKSAEDLYRALKHKHMDFESLDRDDPNFHAEYDKRNNAFKEAFAKEAGLDPDRTHSAVYPMKVEANNTFNPETDMDVMAEYFAKNNTPQEIVKHFQHGNYLVYENQPVVDFLKSKGYDSMRLRESTDDNFPTIAVFNPETIRSRFAAFDPFRKTAATAAAMGVAAPDLLAKEQDKAKGGLVHLAGGGDPKKADSQYTLMGDPSQFSESSESKLYPKTERMNRGVKAIKSGLDSFNRFIDQGPTVRDVLGSVVGAVPFVGPDLRKGMEDSTLTIPYEFQRSATNPKVATGVNTAKVPTTDILDALKMSDITGGTGASNLLGSVGKGYAPDPMDVLDTLGLGAVGYGAAKAGAKGAKAAGKGALKALEQTGPAAGSRAAQRGAVKLGGGNWVDSEVKRSLGKLKQDDSYPESFVKSVKEDLAGYEGQPQYADDADRMRRDLAHMEQTNAFNKWVDTKAGSYVRNQMATPDDPVIKMLDVRAAKIEADYQAGQKRLAKLDERIAQAPANTQEEINNLANLKRTRAQRAAEIESDRELAMNSMLPGGKDYSGYEFLKNDAATLINEREKAGFPIAGYAQSDPAKAWEATADFTANINPASKFQGQAEKIAASKAASMEYGQYANVELPDRFKTYLDTTELSDKEKQALMRSTPKTTMVEILGDRERSSALAKARDDASSQVNMAAFSMAEDNPYLAKLPPETPVYNAFGLGDLGIDHIIDVLKDDVATGKLKLEDLNKITMDQAVKRAAEYDFEMAKKARDAKVKNQEGFPVHKEYPEGYKWIELTVPKENFKRLSEIETLLNADSQGGEYGVDWLRGANGEKEYFVTKGSGRNTVYMDKFPTESEAVARGRELSGQQIDVDALMAEREGLTKEVREKKLEDALKYEGDTMGHCVGGYCPDVLEGRSRIYSLRDAKGEPHVTVEVKPHANYEEAARILETDDPTSGDIARLVAEGKLPGTQRITQIKGKGNRAPKEEYLPFVQDFVKSGKWSKVGDLQNTGLKPYKGEGDLKYVTPEEYEIELQKELGLLPPTEGMAGGGSVGLRNALNNLLRTDKPEAHMAGGGVMAKVAKAAKAAAKVDHPLVFPRAVPKSLEEIRPIAQRMAEQMTGEFVKQNPKLTTNPAGKSRKQFEREQNIPLETRNVVPERAAPDVNYEDYMGYGVVGVPGDPTLGGVAKRGSLEEVAQPTVELTRVGDITPDYPVPLFGGPRYGDDEKFWASNFGAAVPIQKNASKLADEYQSPIIAKYIKMGSGSENFALHNLDALLAIQRPERLDKDKMARLTEVIQAGSPKYGKFPGFTGFEEPIDVLLQAQMDSNLRKHIAETLTKPTITNELGLANGLDVVAAITHPELRNLETGASGFSVGEMKPGAKLQRGESSHPTYDTDIPGLFLGRSKYPTPYEIAFPDTTAYARSQMTPGVQEFNMMKMLGPRERIDQQYIDEIKMYEELMKKYTGKKKGGLAQTKKVKRHGNTVPH